MPAGVQTHDTVESRFCQNHNETVTMRTALLLLLATNRLLEAELHCPKNTLPFDFEVCDPNRRSQCPSGFTCRKGYDTEGQNHSVYLCCETAPMTIEDWFIETQLSPKVFPQPPKATFKSIEMAPLDATTAFPAVHTGDEVVVLTYPQYKTAIVQSVIFTTAPPPGGFLHVMTIIDPLSKPFAMFFTYNLPSTGSIRLPVPSVLQGMTGRATYIDKSVTVADRKSYRSQYVVLAYHTNTPIIIGNRHSTNNTQGEVSTGITLMGDCNNVECLAGTTTLMKQLNRPVAGSIFYLTTKCTIFDTAGQRKNTSSSALTVSAQIIAVLSMLFYFSS